MIERRDLPITRRSSEVSIYTSRTAMAAAAGGRVIEHIERVLSKRQEARIVFAAAPSQNEVLAALVQASSIDWRRITAFHMDEYIGLPPDSPQKFGVFLRERIFTKLPFREIHYLDGNNAIPTETARYSALLQARPIDIVVLGVGENGHIAFNDPPVADFSDPFTVKEVSLDRVCRQQQVNDGCFATLTEVPTRALTLTIPALMAARHAVCTVPGPTKANAVHDMLYGPLSHTCPASILRTHPDWFHLSR